MLRISNRKRYKFREKYLYSANSKNNKNIVGMKIYKLKN